MACMALSERRTSPLPWASVLSPEGGLLAPDDGRLSAGVWDLRCAIADDLHDDRAHA